ncbi:hypothetical protein I546_0720 [Mycobacterium kansasii 732]|nr:hypothetical protein I546_0720 [Mycobacterium kansasii 732]
MAWPLACPIRARPIVLAVAEVLRLARGQRVGLRHRLVRHHHACGERAY